MVYRNFQLVEAARAKKLRPEIIKELLEMAEEGEEGLKAAWKIAEVYQTVHLKEFTDFPKKDEKDPTTVFTDIHFEKKSVAYEAYHLSHGLCL